MPTPKQQKEYTWLSGHLEAIGHRFSEELPNGTIFLRMTVKDREVVVEAYDQDGQLIGEAPNEYTSVAFRKALQFAFEHSVSPDPNGVVCLL